jgi:hypothetical protein
MEQRIVPRDKLIQDALSPAAKQRRARERYYRRHGEWIAYRRDVFAKKLHDQTRSG